MASPFTVFRRHQKIMLAVVGIGAMVAFVFLDPVMQFMGRGRKQENPVIVETNYGNFTRGELDNLKYSREIVDRFLQHVARQVTIQQVQGGLETRLAEMLEQRHYFFWRAQLMGRSQQDPEKAAIETMVLANRAEQMGMIISDQAINDLLLQITADSVTPTELQAIIRALQPARPISEKRFFSAIRTEMLASQYAQLFDLSAREVPPAQRFEYFSRLNLRATAEVMPLAVGDFVDQVADPADTQLKEFYNKHKNDFPNPDAPEPGFKEPRRATFEYFKASIDQLTEKIKPDVTEEEIAKYYEANKEQFRAFDLGDEAKSGGEPGAEGTQGVPKPEGESPTDAPKAEDPNRPAGEESPTDEKPEAAKPEAAAPTDKPAAPKPEGNQESENAAPQASHKSARSVVRLASMTSAGDDVQETAPPSEKSETSDAPPAKPEASAPGDEKATEAKPSETPEGEKAAADTPAEPPRFEPLEKVADTIRTSLARERAEERVREQLDAISAEMRRYTDEYDIYTTEKGTNPRAKPPAPLNFAKLAEGKDVEALELKSVTAAQTAETDLGKSFRLIQNERSQFPFTVPFVNFAFADTLPTFKSEVVRDNDNNVFLFWKTQEEPAFVPPLDQIREKVIFAWKMIKARDLARKRGEEFAVQARSLKKPLEELFGSQSKLKIADTGAFSWLTLGNVPAQPGAQPRLSEVEGVDRPGADFMKSVFALEPAGIGIAMNEPQTLVYVIRLVKFEPTLDELRDDFARTNPSRYMTAGSADRSAIYQAWLAELNQEAGVKWLRQADAGRERDEDEAGF